MNQLFLICPDCFIESILRRKFGDGIFIITALGAVFTFSEASVADLNNFLVEQKVSEIIIVNDSRCTFIENVVNRQQASITTAESVLTDLYKNHSNDFKPLSNRQQSNLLAKLNTYRQSYEILELPIIDQRIDSGLIKVSGLIYDRFTKTFSDATLRPIM